MNAQTMKTWRTLSRSSKNKVMKLSLDEANAILERGGVTDGRLKNKMPGVPK